MRVSHVLSIPFRRSLSESIASQHALWSSKLTLNEFSRKSKCRPCEAWWDLNLVDLGLQIWLTLMHVLEEPPELSKEERDTWLSSVKHSRKAQFAMEENPAEQMNGTVFTHIGAELVGKLHEQGTQLRTLLDESRELPDMCKTKEVTKEIRQQIVKGELDTLKALKNYLKDGRKVRGAAYEMSDSYRSTMPMEQREQDEAIVKERKKVGAKAEN